MSHINIFRLFVIVMPETRNSARATSTHGAGQCVGADDAWTGQTRGSAGFLRNDVELGEVVSLRFGDGLHLFQKRGVDIGRPR